MGLFQIRTTQGSVEDKPSTKTLVFDTHLLNRIFDRMSAKGQKRTLVTRLQMVRYNPGSGHWASVCLL
jgi:hypothetical protein